MVSGDRYRGLSVAEALDRRVSESPDRVLVRGHVKTSSYERVARSSRALAAAMADLGVSAGDRVVVVLPNGPEFVTTILAVAQLGAVAVPASPNLSATELHFILRQTEAAVAISVESFGATDFMALFEGLLPVLPDLQYLVTVGDEDLWYDDRIFQFEDLLSSGAGKVVPQVLVDPDDLFAIVFTPGSTGKPKGVVLTHRNVVAVASDFVGAIGLQDSDVVFGSTPMYTAFGLGPMLIGTIVAGASVVAEPDSGVDMALDAIARHRVSVHYGVPSSFLRESRAAAANGADISSLRLGVMAGAPATDSLVRQIESNFVPRLLTGYGLTEAGSIVTLTRSGDPELERKSTVGRALPQVEIRIIDLQSRQTLPVESVGEIAVRGPGVMKGYYRQPTQTASSRTADGFFLTGDVGMLDEHGALAIVGRRKELIIKGGQKVHPREVETWIGSHPAVADVAVIGVANDLLGELVCACVVLEEGAILTGDELRDWCRASLADPKVPDMVRFFAALPVTDSGTLRRVELERLVAAEIQA